MMINLSPPVFFQRLFPNLVWSIPNEDNAVFLTFDDGPTPDVTPWVLDRLNRFEAKATFFCLGKNVDRYPSIFEAIKGNGHTLGNHTYSHLRGWEVGTSEYVQDVDLANQTIRSNLFRPPYGRIKPSQVRELRQRYRLIMWDVLSMDYSSNITRRSCANYVIKHLHPGAIIVFHDSLKAQRNLRYALPRVLEAIRDKGMVCRGIEG